MRKVTRRILTGLLLVCTAFSASSLSPEESALISGIAENTLRGHVSFLASDAMEGRDTPSKGLDIAAEYVASQFRRFGLQPAGDDGYFQTAPYVVVTQPMETFDLTLESGVTTYKAPKDRVMITASGATSLKGIAAVKVDLTSEDAALPGKEAIAGKAVILLTGSRRGRALMQKRDALLAMEPAVIVSTGFTSRARQTLREADAGAAKRAPVVTISDTDFSKAAAELADDAKLSVAIQAPVEAPVKLRNVIATLPGSDPELKKSYVLLTAHHDHVGVNPSGDGDRINNGANDDASGVATVLSLAEAFSKASPKPKRTLIFMTYFGEEKGLFGSRYYVKHPVFPLAQTVANLNFEHMGRTDDVEGPRDGKITASGFDYTTLGQTMSEAGQATGVEAWKHEQNSDAFFARSDNQALADAGVPAITVAVAWIFPDYHRVSDHWEKLNYPNMEKAVRMCAVTVWRVAEDPEAPKWIESNPKAANYVKAWKQLHGAH